MRRALAAVVTALLLAAPAAAQSPPPTRFSFDPAEPAGQYTATLQPSSCSVFRNTTGAHSAPWYLYAPCAPTLRLTFREPQASVELFARALLAPADELVATAHTTSGTTVPVTVRDPSTWKPIAFAGSIDYVELRADGADIGVDDLAISTAPQPDTAVLETPAARADGDTATFRFEANRPDVAGWRCALDGAAPAACTSPVTYTGLAPGPHTFRVAAVDAYGAVDQTPEEHAWTVLGPLPDTPRPAGVVPTVSGGVVTLDLGTPGNYECSVDGGAFAACATPFTVAGLPPGPHTIDVRSVDADGRPDPTPERWAFDVPNVRRADVGRDDDGDGIPDSQETLPLGNVKPVAGVRTLARLISGRVYVKLPERTTQQLLSGFVPLKGIAALPVGTTVDARRGTLALQTALDGRRAKKRKLGRARLSAAIFQIRQARLKPRARRARRIATNLLLQSPGTASASCRASRLPRATPVRTLKATAKGLFRVTGGASHAVARNAAWRTTDRCNGTVTRVTRGRVNVYDKGRHRHIVVRRGHRYIARARLFLARKGRRAPGLASATKERARAERGADRQHQRDRQAAP